MWLRSLVCYTLIKISELYLAFITVYRKHKIEPFLRKTAWFFRLTEDEMLELLQDYRTNITRYEEKAIIKEWLFVSFRDSLKLI